MRHVFCCRDKTLSGSFATMRIVTLLAAAGLILGTAHAASANILYTLSGVTLTTQGGAPAGTLTGSFSTNDTRSAVISFDITASASGNFSGFEYTSPSSTVTAQSLPSQYFQLDSAGNTNELRLYFSNGLSATGGTIAAASSYEHEPSGGNRLPSGSVVATTTTLPPAAVPEPASLSLLGAALVGIGLSRRRKQ